MIREEERRWLKERFQREEKNLWWGLYACLLLPLGGLAWLGLSTWVLAFLMVGGLAMGAIWPRIRHCQRRFRLELAALESATARCARS